MQCQNFVEAWWLNMAFAMSNVWGQLGNASVFFLLPFISKGGLTLAVSTSFMCVTLRVPPLSSCVR
jgi:hypothetical protein